jgi:hypothetical protein
MLKMNLKDAGAYRLSSWELRVSIDMFKLFMVYPILNYGRRCLNLWKNIKLH